jgi:purine-binding chemotaxis protein CheW
MSRLADALVQSPDPDGSLPILRLVAGGRSLAIDLSLVQAIERPRRWARLPGAPPYVRGVTELHDQAVVVVDLALRLGLPPGPPLRSAGVVLIDSIEPVALAAEGIGPVCSVASPELEPVDAAAHQAGLVARGPEGLLLLDAEALVDGRPLHPLSEVLACPETEHRSEPDD